MLSKVQNCLVVVLLVVLLRGALRAGESPLLPNFVVIMADDLGYGDLGVYGNRVVRTPNLDRMAREGVYFTNFYAATPTCTPSRAALLTGRYPIRSGLIRVLHPREPFGLPEDEITLAEALKARGYATACIGKWHLGDQRRYQPRQHGFDYFFGLLYSNDMTWKPPNFSRLFLYLNEKRIESPVKQETLTRRYTEETIEFIRKNRKSPFFIYVPHTMPHVPLHASSAFRGKSSGGLYGDVVEELDWSVGEIMRTLMELELDSKTLVTFTSDNGPAVNHPRNGGSAGPLRGGKRTTWEGGVRVPFVARWPGHIPSGLVQNGMATAMDLFPTLVHLAGGKTPDDREIDGRDILSLLEGDTESPHAAFFYYSGKTICAVRSGNWKLHLARRQFGRLGMGNVEPCSPPELYDLSADPGEQRNLVSEHPEIVAWLTARVEAFSQEVRPGKLLPPWRPLP
ncbi:MAG: sulfatase [Acidobacteriota bacterium]